MYGTVCELVPLSALTVTLTVPVPAGVMAVNCVLEPTTTPEAAFPPNRTAVTLTNALPVIDTDVPPAVDPWFGVTPLTTGAMGPPNGGRAPPAGQAPGAHVMDGVVSRA
ncbi:hypothetical protein Psi02_45060 [Planotetraspora silvatica]|uniref:Uncharacterized protein n=1 Tax=Planotetraspora silvatica TaxID=234614 RepID=A0A8J3XN28_9ACTN|nr:hypothetical protein Psi02_45060 [Planotetraspora silvatica]